MKHSENGRSKKDFPRRSRGGFLDGLNVVSFLFAPPRLRAEDYYVDIGDVWRSVGDSMGQAMGLKRDDDTGQWVRVIPVAEHAQQILDQSEDSSASIEIEANIQSRCRMSQRSD